MADNGIMLGNATVSDQTPRDSGAGNFMNHRANNRAETGRTTESAPLSAPLVTTRRHNGMVDTLRLTKLFLGDATGLFARDIIGSTLDI